MDALGDLAVLQVEEQRAGPVFFAINPDVDATADAQRTTRLLRVKNGLTGVPYRPDVLHVKRRGAQSGYRDSGRRT